MNRMLVRIHKKNDLIFFHSSSIYDAFFCGSCMENKLYLLEECDQTKFFKVINCFQLCCSEPCSSCGTVWCRMLKVNVQFHVDSHHTKCTGYWFINVQIYANGAGMQTLKFSYTISRQQSCSLPKSFSLCDIKLGLNWFNAIPSFTMISWEACEKMNPTGFAKY